MLYCIEHGVVIRDKKSNHLECTGTCDKIQTVSYIPYDEILSTESEKSRGFDKRTGDSIKRGNETLPGKGFI